MSARFLSPQYQKRSSQIRSESKQQFFSIKRPAKRLKTSNIFSQQSDKPQDFEQNIRQIIGLNSFQHDKQKLEELASTFGSDNFLQFRRRPLKRKKYPKTKRLSILNSGDQSESDSQTKHLSYSTSLLKETIRPFSNNLKTYKPLTIDDFIILAKIGEGTYSQVFRAKQKKTGFICSLKILNKQKVKSLKVEQNLFRQIKISSFLDHPNLARLYGCFSDEESIYLISELATGRNVYDQLNTYRSQGKKGFQMEKVKGFIRQLCNSLEYMHRNNILHRDVKPQNMLVTFDNTVKLCDFGWSVYNPDKTLRTTLCGTPLYLAPELIQQNQYDDSVDVWAVGVLTYQLITNEIPFKIRSIKDLKKVVTEEVCYEKVGNFDAIDFISNAMKKRSEERKSIFELKDHVFLSQRKFI